MAPLKKVNQYDERWKKQWYDAGIFSERSEGVNVDVVKKLKESKVLGNVEKVGLLSKEEGLGLNLSSIELFGIFSKAEELDLLEQAASFSPDVLASIALPLLLATDVVVFIHDDSAALVVLATILATSGVGLSISSDVLGGLQKAD